MASIYRRGAIWWVKFTDEHGELHQRSLRTRSKKAAARAQLLIEQRLAERIAEASVSGSTLQGYAEAWKRRRRATGVQSWEHDHARLVNHVFPDFGDKQLATITPAMLARWAEEKRATGMAPKTLHNVYGVLRSLYRQAMIDGVVAGTPCVLNKATLGKMRDKDPTWRPGAIYSKTELVALISSTAVPDDRRLFYAFGGLAGLRTGEVCGLQWKCWDRSAEPLGRLMVLRSHERDGGKTGISRAVPVHPRLAAMIAEWRFHWPAIFDRQPGADDLILPTMGDSARTKPGLMRNRKYVSRRFGIDLDELKLRHRRFHDLRRTFISLAIEDGAAPDVLRTVTHTAGGSTAFDIYKSFTWAAKCSAVTCLGLNTTHENEREAKSED